jgi:hypothetical protein
MQAIATLHAQLNLATEKLDHAQKSLAGIVCFYSFKCHSDYFRLKSVFTKISPRKRDSKP